MCCGRVGAGDWGGGGVEGVDYCAEIVDEGFAGAGCKEEAGG